MIGLKEKTLWDICSNGDEDVQDKKGFKTAVRHWAQSSNILPKVNFFRKKYVVMSLNREFLT